MYKNEFLIYHRAIKGRLKIDKLPLLKMEARIQDKKTSKESGGILLGRFIANSDDIVIDDITTPMIGDKQTRSFFFRHYSRHQDIIKEKWIESNQSCNYLGEWHTHAQDDPSPSFLDVINWKNLMKKGIFDDKHLFFIITGIKKLNIWEGDIQNLSITQINLEEQK